MDDKEKRTAQRYYCKFSNCDKSFQRREHLTRHTGTHSESKHVCKVCQKEFSRSDSLQRHLNLHGDAYRIHPSGRSKRACVTCRASKIKCDGEQPCSKCRQRNHDCQYDQLESEIRNEVSKSSTSAPELFGYRVSHETVEDSSVSIPQDATTKKIPKGESQVSFQERLSAALNRNTGPIDWTSAMIRNGNPQAPTFTDPTFEVDQSNFMGESWPSTSEAEKAAYLKLYFAHFHHRWPILHAPRFDIDAPPILQSCVVMIGAYIQGTGDAEDLVIRLYGRMNDYIFPRLSKLSSEDNLDQLSTLTICQAALLFVIFCFYCGEESKLHKAIVVRSMLVTALREMSIFKSELPVSYDKPGYFLPLRHVKEETAKRLSIYLFKIDSYLAILRSQPKFLTSEELHFSLPSTFALWNTPELYIFGARHANEPSIRSETKMCNIIREPSLEASTHEDEFLLIEDIQIGICAMHVQIWQLRERSMNTQDQGIGNAIERDALKRRLDVWKQMIFRLPNTTNRTNFSNKQPNPYYYGTEDHSQPEWESSTLKRPEDLKYDTLILYNLLSMHLFADVRTLTQLAKDTQTGFTNKGEIYIQARKHREASTRAWVESAAVRRALTHALEVLVSNDKATQPEDRDPIAFVALSTAALVIWAYCMYGGDGCHRCITGGQALPFFDGRIVELTDWSGFSISQVLEKDRETWIEMGGCRGAMLGLPLCRCNIDLLMAKFREYIPRNWNVANTIAPGIFRVPV